MTTRSRTLCTYFRRGSCRFGSHCWFSHDLNSINGSTRSSTRGATSDEDDLLAPRITYLRNVDFRDASPTDGFPPIINREHEQAQKLESNKTESPQILWTLKKNSSGETAEGTSDSILVEITKKLNEAENQVVTLRQQLCKKNEGKNFSWVEDQMEKCVDNDLQCSICYELLVKPTVLNCSHTFCLICIETWIKVVNQCPTCRVQIKNKAYCLTLDTFIDKIAEFLPDEIKSRRETLKTERNNLQETNQNRRNARNYPRNNPRRRNRNRSLSQSDLGGMNVIWTNHPRSGAEWNISLEEALFNPIRLGDVLGRNQNERDEWDADEWDSSSIGSFNEYFCSYCDNMGHADTDCPLMHWEENEFGGQW